MKGESVQDMFDNAKNVLEESGMTFQYMTGQTFTDASKNPLDLIMAIKRAADLVQEMTDDVNDAMERFHMYDLED